MEANRERGVEVLEDGGSREATFELVKSSLTGGGPVKLLALTKERGNCSGDSGITFNETTVEISKTKEDLDFLNRGGNRPFGDCNDAVGIH